MAAEWRSLKRVARRNATGHCTVVFTKRPLRTSLSKFRHAAASSADVNSPPENAQLQRISNLQPM